MYVITIFNLILLTGVYVKGKHFQNQTYSSPTIFSTPYLRNIGNLFLKKDYNDYLPYDYRQILNNLFLSEKELESLKYNEQVVSRATIGKFRRKWTKSNEKNLNVCSKTKRTISSRCSPCCETEFTADVPYTVIYEGKSYNVIQPPDGYQVIFQGICQSGTACSYGRCIEENSYYTWILVEDPALNYYPPMKFVPVQYSKMCACVNIGS